MKSLEIRSKSKEEAISKAIEKLNVKLDDLEIEVLENPTKGFLGFLGAKDGLYKFTVIEQETEIDIAKAFIENILKNSKVDADLSVSQEGNLIKVDIRGKGTKENGRICFDGKVDAIIFPDKKLWIYLPVLKFWFRFLPFGFLPCL